VSLFVFRNATIEPFFKRSETEFSGYGDISRVPENAEKICWFYTFPPDAAPNEMETLAEDFLQRLRLVLAKIPAKTPVELTKISAPEIAPIALSDKRSEAAVARYNAALENLARERGSETKILPAPNFSVDWRLWFLAQTPFSPAKKREEKSEKTRVPAVRKKCLVLDCDDTIWGGTLGEDGATALKIGGDYPANAFSFFQKKLVELAESGIILAVCSKNDDAAVRAVFAEHPAMILREKHISAWRVNWRDKAKNIQEIAEELNIGLDSIVFADNDPRERARVAEAFHGAVAVPAFPQKPWELPDFFENLLGDFFRTEKLTAEDLRKTQQYRDETNRSAFQENFSSVEDYLAALEIKLCVAPANDFSLPRIAQLTQKTNQFNLTTRRRTEAELRDFLARGNAVFSLSASDKIGDLGIVGVAEIALNFEKKSALLENFLMSCRALGRGIETAFAQKILNEIKSRGVEKFYADFFPNEKNSPCRGFLESLGFAQKPNGDGTRFFLDLAGRDAFKISPLYQFSSND